MSLVKKFFAESGAFDSIYVTPAWVCYDHSKAVFTAGSFATVGRCAAIISCVHNTQRNPGAFEHLKHFHQAAERTERDGRNGSGTNT